MRAAFACLVAAATVLAPATAASAAVRVDVQFGAFAPSALAVLPGETVEWANISERRHTITADDGLFDSGDILGGDHFAVTFDAVGTYPYHCRLHAGMDGQVDVRRVTLGAVPTALVPAGERFDVDGRTADPASPVRIERDTGHGFETVATATPDADGTWRAELIAERSADYRAATGSDVSQKRRLLVSDRRVIVRSRRGRVSVRVVPPAPYARVMLELRLRDRFGWWPQAWKRVDYLSRGGFRVRRPVQARVSLVDKDGWTRLAVSPVVRVRR